MVEILLHSSPEKINVYERKFEFVCEFAYIIIPNSPFASDVSYLLVPNATTNTPGTGIPA